MPTAVQAHRDSSASIPALPFLGISVPFAVAAAILLPVGWGVVAPILALSIAVGSMGTIQLLLPLLMLSGISFSALGSGQDSILPGLGGSSLDGLRLVFALLAFGLLWLRNPQLVDCPNWLVPFLLYLAWCLSSITWAPDKFEGLRFFLKILFPMLCFFLVRDASRPDGGERVRRCIRDGVLIGVALNLVVAGLPIRAAIDVGPMRLIGTAGPNTIGLFCAMTGIAMYAWFIKTRLRGFMVAWLLTVGLLLATGSRTAVIAAAVAMVVFEASRRKWKRILFLGVAALALWIAVPTLGERTNKTGGLDFSGGLGSAVESTNLSGRLLLWGDVWSGMVSGSDFRGHGLAATSVYLAGRYPLIRGVHNIYIQAIAETGVAGLVLLLLAIAILVAAVVRISKRGALEDGSLALAGIACFLVAGFAENVQSDYSSFASFPLIYVALLKGVRV